MWSNKMSRNSLILIFRYSKCYCSISFVLYCFEHNQNGCISWTVCPILTGFSTTCSSKYEAYIALGNLIFILFEFRLILLDRITYAMCFITSCPWACVRLYLTPQVLALCRHITYPSSILHLVIFDGFSHAVLAYLYVYVRQTVCRHTSL